MPLRATHYQVHRHVREEGGIVVVGGYGAVGRTVCSLLAQRFPGHVFAAGRNLRKAEAFSERRSRGRTESLVLR